VCVGACFLPELSTEEADGGDDPCTTCASSSCIQESTACFADMACSELVNCIFACEAGDDACINDCTTAEGAADGFALAIPLAECTADNCADECPDLGFTGSGGAGGSGGTGGGGGAGGAGGA
jgi:hypothetical protein